MEEMRNGMDIPSRSLRQAWWGLHSSGKGPSDGQRPGTQIARPRDREELWDLSWSLNFPVISFC